MKQALVYISFIFSLIAISLASYLIYENHSKYRPRSMVLDSYSMTLLKAGDFLSISGYFIKRGGVYELHQTEESSRFKGINGFFYMTVLHPPENVKEECLNSWVHIRGTGKYSTWGDTIDSLHAIGNLENGETCMKDENLRVNYLDVLFNEHK